MKKSTRDLLLAMSMIHAGDYGGYFPNNKHVVECLWDMYFYMLYSGVDEERKEEYFNEFSEKYNKLTEEQREEVRKEYISIIASQEKNKEKVKRKGMNEYE